MELKARGKLAGDNIGENSRWRRFALLRLTDDEAAVGPGRDVLPNVKSRTVFDPEAGAYVTGDFCPYCLALSEAEFRAHG